MLHFAVTCGPLAPLLDATNMSKPKKRLVTTLICDRIWGRVTCSWLNQDFPELLNQTLVFDSTRLVSIMPLHHEWLKVNRILR